MRFTSYLDRGQLTVELTGEIDHHCAKEYIDSILAKIEAYTPQICVLNFANVSFMDSSGIAVIINALRHMSKIGGCMVLSELKEQPMKVVQASGIDKLIKIEERVT